MSKNEKQKQIYIYIYILFYVPIYDDVRYNMRKLYKRIFVNAMFKTDWYDKNEMKTEKDCIKLENCNENWKTGQIIIICWIIIFFFSLWRIPILIEYIEPCIYI